MQDLYKPDSSNQSSQVSVIIGCLGDDIGGLKTVFSHLEFNSQYIAEIICVVSGLDSSIVDSRLEELKEFTFKSIKFITFEETLFPGAARNVGIKNSNQEYVAFIDVNTIPTSDWLKNSLQQITSNNLQLLLGRTIYLSNSTFEHCFILATYGLKPIYTLPGTVAKRSIVKTIGHFLPSVRAGEDAEWIDRALHFESAIYSKHLKPLKYSNLKDKPFMLLLKKWYRNYCSSTLDILLYEHQRYMYLAFFSLLILLIAFFWNWQIAGWNQNYYLYFPHVSKIATSILLSIYIIFRTLILPLRKGMKLKQENPLTLLLILLISLMIDLIKLFAFFNSSLKRILRKYWLF